LKRLFIIFVILFFASNAWGATETFYVSFAGNGCDADGSAPEVANCDGAFDMADFNNVANWDTDDQDDGKIGYNDEVLFMDDGGTFTSAQFIIPSSGSADAYITLKAQPGDTPILDADSPTGNTVLSLNADAYIKVDGLTLTDGIYGIYIGNGANNIIVDNCTIYEIGYNGFFITGNTTEQIHIGSSSGNGNTVYNCGLHSEAPSPDGGFSITDGASYVYVRYNEIYQTGTTFGVDGITLDAVDHITIEHNTIRDHDDTGCEDHIDIKRSNNIDIGFNHLYGNTEQSEITVQCGTYEVDIYNNNIHGNTSADDEDGAPWGGVFFQRGYSATCWGSNALHDITIRGNVFYWLDGPAIVITNNDDNPDTGDHVYHYDILIYNNIFAENGTDTSTYTAGGGIYVYDAIGEGAGVLEIKNNIFYKNKPNTNTYRQLFVDEDDAMVNDGLDYNQYYWPEQTSQSEIDAEVDDSVDIDNQETHGAEGDPGLVGISSQNYKIDTVDSAVVGEGVDLGTDYDDAFGDETDFSTKPPTVEPLLQGSFSTWEIGPYVWESPDSPEPPPPFQGDNDFSGDANAVALYSLNDGALTTDTLGTNTLTNNNTVTNNTSEYMEGDASGDFEFDEGEYMSCADADLDADFPLEDDNATLDLSITAWIKFESLVDYSYVWGKYADAAGDRSLGLFMTSNDTLCLITSDNAEYQCHGTPMVIDRWYHVAVTKQEYAYRIRIYDNTAEAMHGTDRTGVFTNAMVNSDAAWQIGSRGAARYFDGEIDEVVVFKDILTVQEIDQIRNGSYGRTLLSAGDVIEYFYTDGNIVLDSTEDGTNGNEIVIYFRSPNTLDLASNDYVTVYAHPSSTVNNSGGTGVTIIPFNGAAGL